MFLTVLVVQLKLIAQRSEASVTQVKEWVEKEDWHQLRGRLLNEKQADLTKKTGAPREAKINGLEICNSIAGFIKWNLDRMNEKKIGYGGKCSVNARDLEIYTRVMKNVHELRNMNFKELGLGIKAEPGIGSVLA